MLCIYLLKVRYMISYKVGSDSESEKLYGSPDQLVFFCPAVSGQ